MPAAQADCKMELSSLCSSSTVRSDQSASAFRNVCTVSVVISSIAIAPHFASLVEAHEFFGIYLEIFGANMQLWWQDKYVALATVLLMLPIVTLHSTISLTHSSISNSIQKNPDESSSGF